MNPQEQNIAIAEWCGWKQPTPPTATGMMVIDDNQILRYQPDYLNDLNAIHDAVDKLEIGHDGSQADDYQQELFCICNPNVVFSRDELHDVGYLQNLIQARANQCCEALLRTIGKWKDS